MTKPNKDGWIRHRGGNCPVDAGTLVDVRHRDGEVVIGVPAKEWIAGKPNASEWRHNKDEGDIMAWRPHKAERATTEQSSDVEIPSAEQGGPTQWRDRIREIDGERFEAELSHSVHIERLDHERTSLVAKLKDEGFLLIQGDESNDGEESAHSEEDIARQDMSDWHNWEKGDICEVIGSLSRDPFSAGELVELLESGRSAPYCKGARNEKWPMAAHKLKWHSRPTN